MKQFISVFFLLVVFLLSLFSSTSLNFYGGTKSRSLQFTVDSVNTKTLISLKQNEKGTLEVNTPPFISFKYRNFRLGELRLGGTSELTFNPMETDRAYIHNAISFKNISTPSLNPELSGVAYESKYTSIAAFNPILNPDSPKGLLININKTNLFATISNISESNSSKSEAGYQVEWKSDIPSKNRTYILVGGKSSINFEELNIISGGFTDFVFDFSSGNWGYSGIDIGFQQKTTSFFYSRRISGSNLNEEPRIVDGFSYTLIGNIGIKVQYEHQVFPEPVYGGTSRKESYKFSTLLNIYSLKLKSTHSIETEESTGHSGNSEFVLSTDRIFSKTNWLIFGATLKIQRREGITTEKFKASIRDRSSNLSIDGTKLNLTLSFKKRIGSITFKASVNQDRVFSISMMNNRN